MNTPRRADSVGNARATVPGKPVDLVHLSSQTMGDSELEREVLSIFLSQSDILFNAWTSAGDEAARRRIAHTLKGASRAIGAWGLAEMAEQAETQGACETAALRAAITEVCDYIRLLH